MAAAEEEGATLAEIQLAAEDAKAEDAATRGEAAADELDAQGETREPYYWETTTTEVPVTTKVWHNSFWVGSKILEGMEFAGEIVANFFGLTQSKYQWVLDAAEAEERRRKQHELEESQRRELVAAKLAARERQRAQALEGGEGGEEGGDEEA